MRFLALALLIAGCDPSPLSIGGPDDLAGVNPSIVLPDLHMIPDMAKLPPDMCPAILEGCVYERQTEDCPAGFFRPCMNCGQGWKCDACVDHLTCG